MNLLGSLMTTGIIVAGVWGIAVMQIPSESQPKEEKAELIQGSIANKVKQHAQTLVAKVEKQVTANDEQNEQTAQINIVGISRNVKLKNIADVWQLFESNKPIQNSLNDNPNRVFVYYRGFQKNYQEAQVTIGYPAALFDRPAAVTSIENKGYASILAKGAHSSKKLLNAWQNIDYQKKVDSVLEIHYLDKNAIPYQSEVFVRYQ